MNVVVTGGAGFIGANLCRTLVESAGIERVVALDDLSTGDRSNLDDIPDVELVVGSILDPETLAETFEGADAVVHLAARPSVPRSLQDPFASHNANATGTVRVLEAARQTGDIYVVVASSSSVYGANPELPKREDQEPQPVSPYAASKLATEAYTLSYARSFGLSAIAFRFFNVYGPLQRADHAYAAVIPAFVASAMRGDPLTIHGDGKQTRDFTFVGSLAKVIVDALRRKVTSDRAVNLAFGSRISLLELVSLLEELIGRSLPVTHTDPRPGDVRDTQADSTQLEHLFQDLTPVPIVEGLRQTVAWFGGIRH